jgi:hypothetical protein
MVGSNIFARCLLDMVSPANTRRANIADLLLISDRNGKYLSGTFEDDNAVVLRSLKDASNSNNNYLAKTLAKRLGVKRLEDPWVVTNLAVRDDEKSAYGLILVPTDATKMIVAPQLKKENHKRRFTLYDANGMPIFNDKTDKTGKRQVWTRDNGLSRLCLYWDLSLYSDDGDLANSNDVGRVVELSSEAADANFVRQLTQIYEAQQSELSQRFGATKKMSRGGK